MVAVAVQQRDLGPWLERYRGEATRSRQVGDEEVAQVAADMRDDEHLAHLGDELRMLGWAVNDGDGAAIIYAANRMHNTLSAIVEHAMPDPDWKRVQRDYVFKGRDPKAHAATERLNAALGADSTTTDEGDDR